MADPFEFVPTYVSPLTEKQHAQIGRIALLWGQIEWHIDCLMPRVSGLSTAQLKALAVTEKPMGAKVDFLKASGLKQDDVEIASLTADVCRIVHETKTDRNHIFHGIWGLRTNDRLQFVEPAARKASSPEMPYPATKLSGLEKKLCKCSRMCGDLISRLDGIDDRVRYTRFWHGKTVFPLWLQQWLERNPMDCESLDRNAKVGRLPYQDDPIPQK